MCGDCIKQRCPDRGSICLDTGAYLLNFQGCSECKVREPLVVRDRHEETEEDGEETVTYQHVCPNCMHVIAEHSYTFSVEDDFQEYQMFCMLCGRGADTVSVLPDDPRRQQPLF
ncbi:protein Churchill-like [Ptychodera flava]|uniref:protein Churchill-like n=1 Tax=Ptychodera flava TaxID=63121 RepID=UPI00396A28C9